MESPRTRNTFRMHLILTSGIATLAFGALVAASLFVPLAVQLDRSDIDPVMMGGISQHFLDLHRGFWPVMLGSLLASILSGILLFQRMAGPLKRFVSTFESIERGEVPPPITIRGLDYLTDETAALNRMLVALRAARSPRQPDTVN